MALKGQKGFTLIEVIIAAMVGGLLLTGSVSLITNVYQRIYSSKLKTYSLNLAEENIEYLKSFSFSGLKVTPDDLLPEPLSNLHSEDNPWGNPNLPENIVSFGGIEMRVYKIVQYAIENSEGNIEAITRSEAETLEPMMKKIRVIVTYTDDGIDKKTELFSVVSDAKSFSGGVTIKGRVAKKKTGGQSAPPGQAARVIVSFEGHPEYTTLVDTDQSDPHLRGYYAVDNVAPGAYNLYVTADEYDECSYEGNPLVVDASQGIIDDVDIYCPPKNYATIKGTVYDSATMQPIDPAGYISDSLVKCSDTTSEPVYRDDIGNNPSDMGEYIIEKVNPDNSPVNVYGIFTDLSGTSYYGEVTNINITANNTYTADIYLSPSTVNSTLKVYTYDARDLTTPLNNAAVTLAHESDSSKDESGLSDSSGLTTLFPETGNYTLSASLANYKLKESKEVGISAANNPDQHLYLYPVGSISGTIEDVNGNAVPNVNVIAKSNYGSGKIVAEAVSNTINGSYLLEEVPAANDIFVQAVLEEDKYTCVSPNKNAYYSAVVVNVGSVTTNKDFVLEMNKKPVTGSLELDSEILENGVIIIACPSSVTLMPHEISAGNIYTRKKFPSYGIISKRNGSYSVDLPMGYTYDIYAYYSYIDPETGNIVKKYGVVSSVAADSDNINFDSGWNTY